MSALKIIVLIVQVICALALIAIVILQSGKSAGLSGAISGAADSFLAKGKTKGLDARLASATKWVAIVFAVVTLALNLL